MRGEKIASVSRIGRMRTLDIEVDSDTHVFYGNGIVTSNSHSISYATVAYWSSYIKCHYNREFFKHWLRSAADKIDPDKEKKELILAAKAENIEVRGPHISILSENFTWANGAIYYGICNVKNVGVSHLDSIRKHLSVVDTKNWTDILVNALPHINKRAVENLIQVGAFSGLGKSRTNLLHEYSCISDLTKKELESLSKILDKTASFQDNLDRLVSLGVKREGGYISTDKRRNKLLDVLTRLKSPGRSLSDSPYIYSKIEEHLLGYNINHSELDECADASFANSTCKEVSDGRRDKSSLAAVLKKIKVHKTKKGDDMAFLSLEDNSGELENVVVFPEIYGQCKDILYETATVLITGKIDDKKSRKSFIVESIYAI